MGLCSNAVTGTLEPSFADACGACPAPIPYDMCNPECNCGTPWECQNEPNPPCPPGDCAGNCWGTYVAFPDPMYCLCCKPHTITYDENDGYYCL